MKMFEARVKGLIRHGRRVVAVAAIAAVITFGVPSVLAQTMATGGVQSDPTAGGYGPLQLVSSAIYRVMRIVRLRPGDATETGKRQAEIRQAAAELFDFDEMSRRLLGQHWMDASVQEQQDFVALFTSLLQGAYLNTIGNYPLATMRFQGETINGPYAQVQSRMVVSNKDVAIEYRLLERDGQWGVYDIAVDGVSLISNYRSQFTSMLKRMSFAQVLDRLRNMEASVKSRQDPD
jgi:phospholipid transport system substrate-binding protein